MPKVSKSQPFDTAYSDICTIPSRNGSREAKKPVQDSPENPKKPLFYSNSPETPLVSELRKVQGALFLQEPNLVGTLVTRKPDFCNDFAWRHPYPDLVAITDNRRRAEKDPQTYRRLSGESRPFDPSPLTKPAIHYKDQLQATNFAEDFRKAFDIPEIPRCSGVFITGRCTGSHKHLKAILCGKEWCPDCGRIDSMVHRRRQGRWYAKVQAMESVGYMVITIPASLREHYATQKSLSDFRTYIKRKLQRTEISGRCTQRSTQYSYTVKRGKYKGKVRTGTRKQYSGYMRGLMRWHFAGDCYSCKGAGCVHCRNTGAGYLWHPHLNILIPEGFIKPAVLKKFKDEITNYFRSKHGNDTASAVVHYSYTRKAAKKAHILRYVTRATWRIYRKEIVSILHGYHMGSTWGNWKDAKAATPTTYTEAYERNCCMRCLEDTGELSTITWDKVKLTRLEASKIIRTYNHKGDGYFVGFTDLPFEN